VLLDYAMVHVHNESAVLQQNPGLVLAAAVQGRQLHLRRGGVCTVEQPGPPLLVHQLPAALELHVPAARAYSRSNVIDWVKRVGFDGIRADAIKHVDGSWMTELRTRLEAERARDKPHDSASTWSERPTTSATRATCKLLHRPDARSSTASSTSRCARSCSRRPCAGASPLTSLKAFMDGNDSFYGATPS
jgi:hypothetical protein